MGEAAIRVEGLRKSYGDNEAVRGIDFEVAAGEVFGFLGPNGAGKTTTIEILEGYRPRTGGTVSVLGVDPGAPTREWRNRVGLVLQECEMNPVLTVRETVTLFSSFFSSPRPVEETIELVGLGEKREARIATLSGGQKRRVDVACGIIGDPDLVFLDEPTTGFDPSARRDAWTMIEGLKDLGKTVFLTTHYMDEAQHLADRVAILRGGELVAEGSTEELGTSLGQRTVVRFGLPNGVGARDLGARISAPLQIAGREASFATEQPQRDVYHLLGWAQDKGVELAGLEVRRPSLEDIFLELTSEGEGGR
ncbi:MAG TPA: ABC transporter ATP-binding protein [Solirubrobacterales bacterium]|nr:ABC transporter ATP-binding protein [Solirubrobacterales bacterium]